MRPLRNLLKSHTKVLLFNLFLLLPRRDALHFVVHSAGIKAKNVIHLGAGRVQTATTKGK